MSEFNGSLWTLILEWTCYMIIAVFVASGAMRYARALVGALAALFFLVQLDVIAVPAIYTLANPSFAGLALVFLTGSVLAVYADRIPFHDGLGALSGLALVASLRFGGFEWLGLVAGAYFVLYMGVRLPRRLQWIGRKNDYSYGIYIYGFLVQQVLAHYGVHKLGYLPYMLFALILAFGLAWLSWHGVEKRAMALKGWGPGRGWRHWYRRLARRGR